MKKFLVEKYGAVTIGLLGTIFAAMASTTSILALAYSVVITPIKDTQSIQSQEINLLQKEIRDRLGQLEGKMDVLLKIQGINPEKLNIK
jgi:hypothetical protein